MVLPHGIQGWAWGCQHWVQPHSPLLTWASLGWGYPGRTCCAPADGLGSRGNTWTLIQVLSEWEMILCNYREYVIIWEIIIPSAYWLYRALCLSPLQQRGVPVDPCSATAEHGDTAWQGTLTRSSHHPHHRIIGWQQARRRPRHGDVVMVTVISCNSTD